MSTLRSEPDYLFHQGPTFTVEWYRDAAGRMKAKEYYDLLPIEDQARLKYIVRYMADSPIGTRLPKKLYNLENANNKIYAFKPYRHRFFNFMTSGRKIIILNAFQKHSQKKSKTDLNVLHSATDAKESYLRRVAEGKYYESYA